MRRTIAIENYRSIRYLVTGLGALTVVTGANGSGKTSSYRAPRLLADLVQDGAMIEETGTGLLQFAPAEPIQRRGKVSAATASPRRDRVVRAEGDLPDGTPLRVR